MVYLVGVLESLFYVYIVNIMLDVKSKRLVKHILTFVWFYGSMLIKQFLDCQVKIIAVAIMFLPLIFICVIPRIIYKAVAKSCVKMVICFMCYSYSTDCVCLLLFHGEDPTEVAVFIAKLLELFIFIFLHKVVGIVQRKFSEYFVIGGYFGISFLSMYVTMFFITSDIYKIFAFVIQTAMLTGFVIYITKAFRQHTRKEMMELSEQELRSLKHDVNDHYNLIYSLYKENKTEELEEYFKNLNFEVQKNSLCCSANAVLENAVNYALNICNAEQIHFQYTLLTDEIPLNNVQQNIVLRNVLNNAIEACRRCQEERYIYFSVRETDYGKTLIECYNSSPQVNGDLSTSKRNRKEHGIGIPTIKRIIKGKGKMMCSYSSGEFLTKILLGG